MGHDFVECDTKCHETWNATRIRAMWHGMYEYHEMWHDTTCASLRRAQLVPSDTGIYRRVKRIVPSDIDCVCAREKSLAVRHRTSRAARHRLVSRARAHTHTHLILTNVSLDPSKVEDSPFLSGLFLTHLLILWGSFTCRFSRADLFSRAVAHVFSIRLFPHLHKNVRLFPHFYKTILTHL